MIEFTTLPEKPMYSYLKYNDETWILLEDRCVQYASAETEERAKQVTDAMNAAHKFKGVEAR